MDYANQSNATIGYASNQEANMAAMKQAAYHAQSAASAVVCDAREMKASDMLGNHLATAVQRAILLADIRLASKRALWEAWVETLVKFPGVTSRGRNQPGIFRK